MSKRHTTSEYLNSKKEERFRPRPWLPLLSRPAETSAPGLEPLEPLPSRMFPQNRQFLEFGTAFPCGKTDTEG